jgi:hypothetical protein
MRIDRQVPAEKPILKSRASLNEPPKKSMTITVAGARADTEENEKIFLAFPIPLGIIKLNNNSKPVEIAALKGNSIKYFRKPRLSGEKIYVKSSH